MTSRTHLYFVIKGVNASSPETQKAYLEAKKELKEKSLSTESYYEINSEISEQASKIALSSLKNATNLTTQIYAKTLYANQTFGKLLNKSLEAYPVFKMLNSTLPELEKAYAETYSNISQAQLQFMRIVRVVNESDRNYLSIHGNITKAQGVVNNLSSAINSFKEHLNTLQKNYTVTFLRVIWTYRGLREQAEAYDLGAAYSCRVASLSLLLHLPEDFIYSVFYATLPAYREEGYAGITDELLANVTMGFVLKNMNSSPYLAFDREFGKEFMLEIQSYDKEHGSNTAIRDNTQDQMKVISQLVNETLNVLPSRLSSSHLTYYFPYLGNVSGENMSFLLKESLSQNNIQNSAADVAIAFGIGNVSKEYYIALLSENSPTDLEMTLLNESVSQKLPQDLKKFSYNISSVIIRYEHNSGYSGVLSSNPGALRNATLEILKLMIPGLNPEEYSALEMKSPKEALTTLIAGMLQEKLSNSNITLPANFSETVAEVITSKPPENWSENPPEEVLSEILNRTFGRYSYPLVEQFYYGVPPRNAAINVFKTVIVPKLTSHIGPDETGILTKALEELPIHYPLTKEYLREFSINETYRVISSWEPTILGKSIHLPAELIANMAWEFRGNSNLITTSDVTKISQEIYKAGLRANEDLILAFKSPSNDSLVMIVESTNGTLNTTTLEHIRRIIEASFKGANPTTTVTMIAPLSLKASSEPVAPNFRDMILITALLGAIILFIALRGPIIATLIPSITLLLALEVLSRTAYGATTANPDVLTLDLIIASSSAFALVYQFTESFRRELALSQSHGHTINSGKTILFGTIIGILTIIGVSSVTGLTMGFPIEETAITALLLSISLILLAAVLYLSLRILGDKLIFWWPMSEERVLHIDNGSGWKRLLRTGLAVFVISMLVFSAAARLTTPQNSSGILLYGNNVYVVFQVKNGIGEKSLNSIENLAGSLASIPGIEGVYTLTRPYGIPLNLTAQELMKTWASNYVSQNGDSVLLVLRVNDQKFTNIEKAIEDTLRGALKSDPNVEGISFESGIAILTLQ